MYTLTTFSFLRGILICTLIVTGIGCRAVSKNPDVVAQYEQMRSQQQWWDLNRSRAQYVKGRGFYLPDTGQYYDASGRPLNDADNDVQQASFEANGRTEQVDEVAKDEVAKLDSHPDLSSSTNFLDRVKRVTGKGTNPEKARDLFRRADLKFRDAGSATGDQRREKFLSAATLYADAAKSWPESAIEEDSLFKMAECYYFADNYTESEDQFGKLIKKYPNTRYLDRIDALRFFMAKYWLAKHKENPKGLLRPNFGDPTLPWFDSFGHAVKLFDRIRIDDPAGDVADDATMAAANAYFQAGKYHKADQLYTDLRDAFPDSEHQFEAHLLGLKCKLLTYQGPDYDSAPLEAAEKLAKQIKRQFRHQYEQQREVVDNAYAEVRARLAEQDWHQAKYYDRRGEYSGAQHYYQRVAQNYPNTKISQSARERLAELGVDTNPEPNRFATLKKYFEREFDNLPPLKSDGETTTIR